MNPRIVDWRGRRVWLLGASTGIGAALARELHRRGARLALSARSSAQLAELAAALPGATAWPCDAGDPAALAEVASGLQRQWGELDLAVYLAGDYRPMRVADFDCEQALRLLDVNYAGALRFTAAVLPRLAPTGGIALFASVAGYRALPKALAYGPAKAALIHFAESLHLELAAQGRGVWLVNPGFVATRLTATNDFAMPALLTPEQAAVFTVDGLAGGKFEITYPRRFTVWLKLLRCLPYRLYFPLVRRLTGG